jgi:hypothetical protein
MDVPVKEEEVRIHIDLLILFCFQKKPEQPTNSGQSVAAADTLMEEDVVSGDPLGFLRDSPQFAQICNLVRGHPEM